MAELKGNEPTGELTEEQSMAMDFLAEQANQLTRDGKLELWKGNIIKNRPFFSQGNPELIGLAAFVVAAGPSLEKNIEHLQNISGRGVIICVDAALRYCLYRGIVPEYCMLIDGSEKMLKMIEGCDTSKVTLVCTPSASPLVVAAWQGPRYFVTTPHIGVEKRYNSHHLTRIVKATKDLKAGDELIVDEHYEVTFGGVTTPVLCGGNVTTAAHHFGLQALRAQTVIFVGADYSWKHQSHHYAGQEHLANVVDRTKTFPMSHLDLNGEEVFTNFSLVNFKRWHEQLARQFKGTVVNATEGGILGVGEKGVKNPFVEFLTLEEAVKKYASGIDRKALGAEIQGRIAGQVLAKTQKAEIPA